MSKFKVGDLVKVVNWGQQFSTYQDWFLVHMNDAGFKAEWAVRYAFDNELFENESGERAKQKTYQILYTDGYKYLISVAETRSAVYLLTESGIKCAPRKMTLKEIEKELGYEIEIIEENKNE